MMGKTVGLRVISIIGGEGVCPYHRTLLLSSGTHDFLGHHFTPHIFSPITGFFNVQNNTSFYLLFYRESYRTFFLIRIRFPPKPLNISPKSRSWVPHLISNQF